MISRELDLTIESLERFAVGDGKAWRHWYSEWRRLAPDLIPALLTPFPPVRAGARIAAQAGLGGALRLGRRFLVPARVLGLSEEIRPRSRCRVRGRRDCHGVCRAGAVVAAAATAAISYIVFVRVLGVSLPAGLLPFA